jgi:membrane associated rhomboid family serine protease
MGESDRYQEYRQQRRSRYRLLLGQGDNALVWLVAINITAFLILLFIRVVYDFSQGSHALFDAHVLPYFGMPSGLVALSEKPWTLLTNMFFDNSVFRLLSNMLWLWAFGYILQDIAGNRKLIPIFIYGGLTGGIFFLLAHYAFPSLRPLAANYSLMGATAAVTAVAVAATTLAPDYRILRNLGNGIPIWILMLIYLLIVFTSVATNGSAQGFASLGGALAGYLFVVFLRRGHDGSNWMNNLYNWVNNIANPNKKNGGSSAKETSFYNTGQRSPYTKTTIVTQQRIDEILDKINQKGYHFLTDEEKNLLKKASEEDL